MCWSAEASMAMVGLGAVATGVTYHRGESAPIWATLGFFTLMEALQVAGYLVLDQCGTTANRSVTLLSYLHIAIQPFFINAFAMQLVPPSVSRRVRRWVYGLCAVSTAVMLAQILPLNWLGTCRAGTALCAAELCSVSGDWHIAWNIPYNGLLVPIESRIGIYSGFPSYMLAAFVLPLVYGAWRFVILHAVAGPILAAILTQNPNEMPAVWCLFSIAILCLGLSPAVRARFSTDRWWLWPVQEQLR